MRAATMLLALFGFLAASTPSHAQQGAASPAADPETFARAWTEAFNSRDVDRILTFYTDDAVYEDVPVVTNGWGEPLRGHAMIREGLAEGFEALPDLGFELVSASGLGSRMAVEWLMTGTHLGDYPGLPATGRSFSIRGVTLIELEGREIASSRDYYDAYLLMRQLGAVPALGAAGASAERTATSPEDEAADSTARTAPAGASTLPDGTASAIRRVFHDLWSRGDLSAVDELSAPDFVGHFPERTVHGRDGLRDGAIAEQWVYPDILAMQRQLGRQVRPRHGSGSDERPRSLNGLSGLASAAR